MSILKKLFVIACLAVMSDIAVAGADGAIGMVLDLQGSGQIKDGGSTSKLQLLSYLKPQMQVSLDAGSKASLSLYATRTVYQVTGPAVVEIAKDKVNVIQGKPPVAKSLQEKLVVAAENVNVTPGAYRMRGLPKQITIATPENISVLLDKRPIFTWNSLEPASYNVVVQDENDKEIASATVGGNSWKLPANVALADGNTYRWTVSFVSARDGKKHSDTGEFSIATKADADAIAELKPAAGAPIEEWILYATMLQNRGMPSEAHAVWQSIYARRPDLQKAQ
jgi:hypothetical protein